MGYTPPWMKIVFGSGLEYWGPVLSTTGYDLILRANFTDSYPNISLYGNSGMTFSVPTGGNWTFNEAAVQTFKITETAPDLILESLVDANNIYLKTTGAGVVKFGTYTAGVATDSTGYISILDAAGNVRKLMVQA